MNDQQTPLGSAVSQPKPVSMARTAIYTIAASVTVVGLLSALLNYLITPPGF